jgi:hypothetical protein
MGGKIADGFKWLGAILAAIGSFAVWAFFRGRQAEADDEAEAGRERDRAALQRAIKDGDDAEIERLWRKSQRKNGDGT